ncbi:MAG: glycosyltransferase family 2 protein [Candidatus Omnitrophota bacterium]
MGKDRGLKDTMSNDNVFIVIPTYNEAKTIGYIVGNLVKKGFRVVVVDDGSKDHTIIDANKYGADIIVHEKNAGKGRCIREGIDYALKNGCEVAITMDGDGQHDMREIGSFIGEYEKSSADIVVGDRMHNPKKMPFVRRLTNRFMSFVVSTMLGEKVQDSQCGYRLISKKAIENMDLRTSKYEIESEMLLEAKRHGLKISSINIDSIYGEEFSQINPFFDTIRFIKFIVHELFRRKP